MQRFYVAQGGAEQVGVEHLRPLSANSHRYSWRNDVLPVAFNSSSRKLFGNSGALRCRHADAVPGGVALPGFIEEALLAPGPTVCEEVDKTAQAAAQAGTEPAKRSI